MRYFAMIDGRQRGPYELSELVDAGVRPDTYVWCKEMDDWQKAEDVADICRFFRQRVFDLMHPSTTQAPGPSATDNTAERNAAPADDPYQNVPLRFRQMVRKSGIDPGSFRDLSPDTSLPPSPTLFISIFVTLFCFPITGFVAIYYSYKSRRAWQESLRSQSKQGGTLYSDDERQTLKREAHEFDRQAKMWLGITFFLGFIMFAFVGHKFF